VKRSTDIKLRAAATLRDPRWIAVAARDASADGAFVYAVRTTGIYCRPSCSARRARPENVTFHATCEDAERAGFRPCKRCRPHGLSLVEQHAARVTQACRLIERSDTVPGLPELARQAGMSVYHFHRVFKAVTGVTPGAYATEQRAKRVRSALVRGRKVTDSIADAGYNSHGRFYEKSDAMLGMTPTRYRTGGVSTEIHFAVSQCVLGSVLVAATERGVCAIFLGDNPDALVQDLENRFPQARLMGSSKKFAQLVAKVVRFVETPGQGLNLPLDVRGTAFQQRVWQALQKIPAGSTVTYTQVATRIGAPRAVRAVASACAANALAVAIPCHRVVRNDGALAGYRWGVERKRTLLAREVAAVKKRRTRS